MQSVLGDISGVPANVCKNSILLLFVLFCLQGECKHLNWLLCLCVMGEGDLDVVKMVVDLKI